MASGRFTFDDDFFHSFRRKNRKERLGSSLGRTLEDLLALEEFREYQENKKKEKDKGKDKKPPTFSFLQLVGVLTLFGPPLTIGYIVAVSQMLQAASGLILHK